ncbi:MAG: HAD-IC family P-type ATPase, partial [Planctomycetota bacterium]
MTEDQNQAQTTDTDQSEHDHREHHKMMARDFKTRFFVSLVLMVPVLVFSETIQGWLGLEEALPLSRTVQEITQWVLATALMAYGGWPFIKGLFKELKKMQPGMMTLIGLAISVAYVYSTAVIFGLEGEVFFWELATLIVLMLMGHWIEMRSVLGASGALEELVKMIPSEAHRLDDRGNTEDIKVTELQQGDRVLVKPGEKIPTDGTVVDGTTSLDQSMLTGESKPVEKGEGDEVMAGAVNGDSSIKIEVTKTGDETYLSQVVDLVKQAQQSRGRGQDIADKAALILTIVAVSAGLVTLLSWWLIVGETFVYSMRRMVTVMVITCPHALGLAVPLVVAVSTGIAARHGLFIRDRSAFERARNIDAVVFDKTGTLTTGEFGVTDIQSLDDGPEDELLVLAAAVERESEHP